MSENSSSLPASIKLRVFVVAADASTLETVGHALALEGDELLSAMDIAEAIAIASSERPDVAFVDVTLDGGAGLALVHHLPAVCPSVAVYALASPSQLDLGTQALALGAAGLVVSPPSGDALLRAVGEVRARRVAESERARLEVDLETSTRRRELLEGVAKMMQGGDRALAATRIADAFKELSGARGVAIYATKGAAERVRLASVGDATILGDGGRESDVRRGAHVVPFAVRDREVGHAVLEEPGVGGERDLVTLAELAGGVLALTDRSAPVSERSRPEAMFSPSSGGGTGRVYSFPYFQDIAARDIDKAKRHGRRLAVAAILVDPAKHAGAKASLEEMLLSAIRETDVLARRGDELYLLLPETGALGAHVCRRRVLARGVPLSIGVASYPHDGQAFDRLVDSARLRAKDAARSPVHALSLASKELPEIIDTLLDCPMLDAGRGSPFPLDISTAAALSLVGAACREALRGGGATLLVTSQPGMGLASAVRPTIPTDSATATLHVVDVHAVPGCADAEAVVIVAEHGTWACCGRRAGARFKAVHSADPLLADLLAQRLARAAGVRLG